MPRTKNLFREPVDAVHPEGTPNYALHNPGTPQKRFASSRIYVLSLTMLLVLATGCDSRKESANGSSKDNSGTVSTSVEAQKTANPQPQATVDADSSRSQDGSTPRTKEQSGIKVTFIEIGSVNCTPCKMMQPIMKEIEKEYKNQVRVVFYDVFTEQGRPYAVKYRIKVIPTQVFLDKDGKVYFQHGGFFPKDQLVEVLKKQGVK